MTLISLFFYFLLIPKYLPVLLISIGVNYLFGSALIRCVHGEGSEKEVQNSKWNTKSALLFFALLFNLALLAYYKYFNFTIVNIDALFGLSIPLQDIILPLGISFFTFTQTAFLIDAYRGQVDKVDLLSYAQFVSFFPHLIAGPIYHHKDIIHQFENEENNRFNVTNINLGLIFFAFGLFKKVVIADYLGSIAGVIFTEVHTGGVPLFSDAWIGALAYTFQLYFDFSGYCDMAIGLALLFNIRFPINFFSPYKTTSIIDFWRCWHITLSNFLRDYVYIPLGGNRRGEFIRMRNLMITMLLGGLWHGAGWTFVIWGGLHGFYLVVNHLWRKTSWRMPPIGGWAVTFLAVVVAWVFFRAETMGDAIVMLKGMIGMNGIVLTSYTPYAEYLSQFSIFIIGENFMTMSAESTQYVIPVIAVSMAIAFLLPNLVQITKEYTPTLHAKGLEKVVQIDLAPWLTERIRYHPNIGWLFILFSVSVIGLMFIQTTSEFLYFQF
jgi:D-alanyl-lipoteichoic acid acyltransferase DltB (MBOAT superfamily)